MSNVTLDPAVIEVSVNLVAETHDVATGELLDRQEVHNRVTDAGLGLLLLALNNTPGTGVTHFATSTNTAAVDAGDTTLAGEVSREVVTSKTISGLTQTVKYYLGSTVANGTTIAKVALFNSGSLGTLIAAALLATTIPKTSAIAVTFTWTITLAASS